MATNLESLEMNDVRYEFLAEYTLRTLKLKPDIWIKLWSTEEKQRMVEAFFEKNEPFCLVLLLNSTGYLSVYYDWPKQAKNKGIYLIKKETKPIPKIGFRNVINMGDLSYIPLDQLASWVDEVLVPLLSNTNNHDSWPKVVSQDVLRHVHNLKSTVYVVSGQVKGKTLLPLPVGTDQIEQGLEALKNGHAIHMSLVHSIETVIIDWAHQIRDVLKRDSAQPLIEGQHPGPQVEIDFWQARCSNLDCINDQLRDVKVRQMAELLERVQSSYFPSFKSIFHDVVSALTESRDITEHLTPLKQRFDEIDNETDFAETEKHLVPLMDDICKVWATSQYYNTPARIIVFLKEIGNMFIEKASAALDPETIFKGEVEENIDKVKAALRTITAWRETYDVHREKIGEYFPEGSEVLEWEFATHLVFERLDKFLERVDTVNFLFDTVLEFMKLEKIEIGGIKGKMLSAQGVLIHEEFQEYFAHFATQSYNCLDPIDEDFPRDVKRFKDQVFDLDRRLAAILCIAFDDCSGSEAIYKLLDCFGSLLGRVVIRTNFEHKLPTLIDIVEKELDAAKIIYDSNMAKLAVGTAAVHKNMPEVAGTLKWAQELKDRVTAPMKNLKRINHPQSAVDIYVAGNKIIQVALDTADVDRLFAKFDEMSEGLLTGYETSIYDRWCTGVDEICSFNLMQPIITRDPETSLIAVNFDPQLVAVLREVKYLEIRGTSNIPASAANMYAKNEVLRQYVANMDLTVHWYNRIRETVLEVEFPLIETQLGGIDGQMKDAETILNWTSDGLWDYIEETRNKVFDLGDRVQRAKSNVEQVQKIMGSWSKAPLFERNELKNDTLLNLSSKEDNLKKRYHDIEDKGETIHRLLAANRQFFSTSEAAEVWKAYVDYVDEMIVDGFFNTIHCTLGMLIENTDPRYDPQPLFEAQMELQVPDMVFKPSLDFGVADGFYDIVDGLLGDIYKQASLISRLAKHSGQENYQV
jgi:dynein heavy chain